MKISIGGSRSSSPAPFTAPSYVYHKNLTQHLYRNSLFARLNLPHRYTAILCVDIFGLKEVGAGMWVCVCLCVCVCVCVCEHVLTSRYVSYTDLSVYSNAHTYRYLYPTLYNFSSQYFHVQDDKNKHINIITNFLNLFLMKGQVLQLQGTLLLTLPCLVPVLCYQDSHPLQLVLKWVSLLWFALFWVGLVCFVFFSLVTFCFVLLTCHSFLFCFSRGWSVRTNFLLEDLIYHDYNYFIGVQCTPVVKKCKTREWGRWCRSDEQWSRLN